jgi:hypothetical protein
LALPADVEQPCPEGVGDGQPVRISGVVSSSVCCRFCAAIVRSSEEIQGKNQLSPAPLEDRLVGAIGSRP